MLFDCDLIIHNLVCNAIIAILKFLPIWDTLSFYLYMVMYVE